MTYMKKVSNYLVYAMCGIALVFSAGSFTKVYAEKAASSVATPGQPVDLTYAAEKALPSVVTVKVVQNSKIQTVEIQDPFSDFFGNPFDFFGTPNQGGEKQKRKVQTPKRQGSGSGVIISADGYIVTNNHVVDGADEITVTLTDNREFSATIIGTDKTSDLALIKVNGKNLPTITIGDSQKLKIGEWVLAIGNPLFLGTTVTSGIVSAKARSMRGANEVESFIQTDAAINRGNSGGALVNVNGELVGINSMLYSETGSYSGYGFAIPTSIMNKVVDDLKKYGTVQRALLGIQGQDVRDYIDMEKAKGKEIDLGTVDGIYIAKVSEDGSAAASGLKEGDVITEIDGKKLTKMAELQEFLFGKKRPGDKVTITYLRNKAKKTTDITLKNAQGNTNVVKMADLDVLGANLREVNSAEKEQLGINYGLTVLKINKGAFKDAGITEKFIIQNVNDMPMKTIEDLQQAVKEASTSKDPVLVVKGVQPSGKKAYFVVMLQKD